MRPQRQLEQLIQRAGAANPLHGAEAGRAESLLPANLWAAVRGPASQEPRDQVKLHPMASSFERRRADLLTARGKAGCGSRAEMKRFCFWKVEKEKNKNVFVTFILQVTWL